ncbi:isatin hydrolase-like [Ixodes scapularis]
MKAIRILCQVAIVVSAGSASHVSSPNAAPCWDRNLVDLSYPFNNETIYWTDDKHFVFNATVAAENEEWYQLDSISTPTHGGTHLDSPLHFNKAGWSVSQIPIQRLMFLPIALLDIQEQSASNPDYQLTVDDIRQWEDRNGRLPDGCLLLVRSGRAKFWPDRTAYLGRDSRGRRHFPSISPNAARHLAEQRQVYGVGLDTPSLDVPGQTATHVILSARNIYNLENLADLSLLPNTGAHGVVLPMKIDGASGASVRVVAILP